MYSNFDAIALVGFSTFEYSTFETFFRLVSGRRKRDYRVVRTGEEARLVIVDGGNASLVKRLVERLRPNQSAVVVGFSDHGTGLTLIPRPINLSMVLNLADRTFATRADSANTTTTSANESTLAAFSAPAPGWQIAASVKSTITDSQAETAVSASEPTASNFNAVAEAPFSVGRVEAPTLEAIRPARRESPPLLNGAANAPRIEAVRKSGGSVLVVDDSDVALTFIRSRLSAFGLNVDLATSGEEALVRVSENRYDFVFLDVMMEGLDGYQTCKAIKKRKSQSGHSPVVVMLTSRSGTVDKVRGTFAGCDAYLTKPLDEGNMLRVLQKHNAVLLAQNETYKLSARTASLAGAQQRG